MERIRKNRRDKFKVISKHLQFVVIYELRIMIIYDHF